MRATRYVTVGDGHAVHILRDKDPDDNYIKWGWTLCGLWANGLIGPSKDMRAETWADLKRMIHDEDMCKRCEKHRKLYWVE